MNLRFNKKIMGLVGALALLVSQSTFSARKDRIAQRSAAGAAGVIQEQPVEVKQQPVYTQEEPAKMPAKYQTERVDVEKRSAEYAGKTTQKDYDFGAETQTKPAISEEKAVKVLTKDELKQSIKKLTEQATLIKSMIDDAKKQAEVSEEDYIKKNNAKIEALKRNVTRIRNSITKAKVNKEDTAKLDAQLKEEKEKMDTLIQRNKDYPEKLAKLQADNVKRTADYNEIVKKIKAQKEELAKLTSSVTKKTSTLPSTPTAKVVKKATDDSQIRKTTSTKIAVKPTSKEI